MDLNQKLDSLKKGVQISKKGAYKKAIVKISEGDRIDFFANL